MPTRNDTGLLTLRHAAENASNTPISDAEIVAVLRGACGDGSHMRAIFGDVSLQALSHAGSRHGIDLPAILAAYRRAKDIHAAANPELDDALANPW